MDRFPRFVYSRGTEPDVRFSLANERTYLAWLRTALAMIAGGIALEALGLGMHPGFRLAASFVLIVTGILAPAQAWIGWARVERAIRENRPLPSSSGAMTGTAVALAGLLVLLGLVLG